MADGTIYAGNQRYRAAQLEGLSELPAVVADVPEQLAKARALRDNIQAGEWLVEDLDALIAELAAAGTAPQALGLGDDDLDLLLKSLRSPRGRPDPDTLPDTQGEPQTSRGQLYALGQHLLLVGDATDQADVQRLFADGRRPKLMVTDPPYGVSYDPRWRSIVSTVRQSGAVLNDDRCDWQEAYALFPGDVVYVWHAGLHAAECALQLTACGFDLRAQIIWLKQGPVLSRGAYHWQHEPAWYACRRGRSASWRGGRSQTTVWDIPNLNPVGGNRQEDRTGHGTQKPVALFRRAIENHTGRGDFVYDPFVGSGTAIIACELGARRALALELDPRYAGQTLARWQHFSGQPAVLLD